MFTIKNEVCFLKICSQYAKRKINNTVRVCSFQISSVRHLPHSSLLRRPFRQSTNTPTHPLRWNCSFLRSRRKFKSHGKKQSVMLKFTARKSYCFTLIVFVLKRQETIKNSNTKQYLLFSNSGRFSWYENKFIVTATTLKKTRISAEKHRRYYKVDWLDDFFLSSPISSLFVALASVI